MKYMGAHIDWISLKTSPNTLFNLKKVPIIREWLEKEKDSSKLLVAGLSAAEPPELRTVETGGLEDILDVTLRTTELQDLLDNLDLGELNPPQSGAWKPDIRAPIAPEPVSGVTTPAPSIRASTFRPNIDVEQLIGLQNLVREEDGEKKRIAETELQQLLGELSREEFRGPQQAWNIRQAAKLFRQKLKLAKQRKQNKSQASFSILMILSSRVWSGGGGLGENHICMMQILTYINNIFLFEAY